MTIPPPYEPYEWARNLPFVYALKAMHKGDATAEQQQLILKEMMTMSGYYDLSYRPNSDRDTSFAEGKRFIGAQLVKLINLSGEAIEKSKQRTKK
ncbi:hypothetical protein PMPD1_3088 [Paramixta manurensis]|uniref:Uncharacterized protein n=1 Tax=Paramixta manurensis TaxID=2740817 RepID=A0A6M8UGM2_9GAMM|nr:hypothetical protein PMPD1_3088 [Erwiniaceae bacterium PD-1]